MPQQRVRGAAGTGPFWGRKRSPAWAAPELLQPLLGTSITASFASLLQPLLSTPVAASLSSLSSALPSLPCADGTTHSREEAGSTRGSRRSCSSSLGALSRMFWRRRGRSSTVSPPLQQLLALLLLALALYLPSCVHTLARLSWRWAQPAPSPSLGLSASALASALKSTLSAPALKSILSATVSAGLAASHSPSWASLAYSLISRLFSRTITRIFSRNSLFSLIRTVLGAITRQAAAASAPPAASIMASSAGLLTSAALLLSLWFLGASLVWPKAAKRAQSRLSPPSWLRRSPAGAWAGASTGPQGNFSGPWAGLKQLAVLLLSLSLPLKSQAWAFLTPSPAPAVTATATAPSAVTRLLLGALLTSTLPAPARAVYRMLPVTVQGAEFCSSLVKRQSECPRVRTVNSVNMEKFSGLWYVIGTNAQNAFSLFGQQTGQCATVNYTMYRKAKGANIMRFTNKAKVLTNPLREVNSVVISQCAESTALAIRYLCQFMVGEEPISTVVLQLKLFAKKSTRVSNLVKLQNIYTQRYTNAVRTVIGGDAVLQQLVGDDTAIDGETRDALKSVLSSSSTLNDPVLQSGLKMLGSYADVSEQALDTTVTVKGMSNAISLGTIFMTLPDRKRGRLGVHYSEIMDSVKSTSMYCEKAYKALERAQIANQELSGPLSANDTLMNGTKVEIYTEMQRIQWYVRRMQANRRRMFRASWRIFLRINATDPQLGQAAQAITLMSMETGPMAAAINHIATSALNVQRTVNATSPGLSLRRHIKFSGYAFQQPKQRGAMTIRFDNKLETPHNIITLRGAKYNGYRMAIVWGCTKDFDTGFLPQNQVYLLSRTPHVNRPSIKAVVANLKSRGILLSGDNPFLPLTQNYEQCRRVVSLMK